MLRMTRPMTFLLSALVWALFWPASATPADLGSSESVPKEVRFGESAVAFAAGFIRDSLPTDGFVTRTVGAAYTGDKLMLGVGDPIFLRLSKADEASPGDLLTLYRRLHKVFHPLEGRYLGDLFIILGIVRVAKIDQDLATVTIERSYDSIAPGDRAMRFVLPPRDPPSLPGRMLPDSPGVIVDVQDRRTLIGQRNVVYVDWGREDGLAVGDRLEVYRVMPGLPNRMVGELKVIAMEDHTATALISRSLTPILRGDRFTFKGASKDTVYQEEKPLPTKEEKLLPDRLAKAIEPSRPQVDQVKLSGLVGQLQYESGQAEVTPAGAEILTQVRDLLKDVTDAQIRVEGHTDNMEIGPKLIKQFPSNTELAMARANNVVRYLVEEVGIDPAMLSAAGYADTRPVASNASEEGQSKNRRIEILVYPKERSETAPEHSMGRSDGEARHAVMPEARQAPMQ